MRGQERIINARLKGYKPAGWVMIDVGLHTDQNWLLSLNGREVMEGMPLTPYVCLGPGESARTADWSWCVGLRVQVDGDDPVRVRIAHERIKAAGAERVVSSCAKGEDDVMLLDSAKEQP